MKFLGRFDPKARSAFFLNRVEGFEPFEIAMIQNREESEVLADISHCAEALSTKWTEFSRAAGVPAEA